VNGKTHWLWCFANAGLSVFMIDRSRSSPALKKFFSQEFAGVLISIFFTLKKRGCNPVATIYNALTTYLKTGQLPPLPNKAATDS
jgi:hypothetical protein